LQAGSASGMCPLCGEGHHNTNTEFLNISIIDDIIYKVSNNSPLIAPARWSPKEGEQKAFVQLKIYDLLGREVTTLVNQAQSAGTYEVDFPGYGFSSGVYFYTLIIDNRIIDTKKMILIQ
jgi:hypothetical protein